PCGNYGSSSKICLCSAKSVDMYWRKFSGPLLDRIDIRIKVENPGENDTDFSVPTHVLRESVARAVKIQRRRQGKKNANLTPQEILDFCILDESERKFMEEIEISNDFSKRALSSILKLSRTLADMEEKENIGVRHLKEAISLRSDSGPLSLFAGDL
ncbi:MAG: ATP-binding protein, partial [Treponema sp.]|nr:ATP-binding protein [Treponema sp.]